MGVIDLYVDLKHDDKEVEDTQRFWELLGTINQLADDINFGYDLLRTTTTNEKYHQIEIAIELNEKTLEKNVENLVNFSNSMRQKFLGMTSFLREQLKAYE